MQETEREYLLQTKKELEQLIAFKKQALIRNMTGSLNDDNIYNYLQRLNSELGSINKKLASSKTR